MINCDTSIQTPYIPATLIADANQAYKGAIGNPTHAEQRMYSLVRLIEETPAEAAERPALLMALGYLLTGADGFTLSTDDFIQAAVRAAA